jgi:hypothetical protein
MPPLLARARSLDLGPLGRLLGGDILGRLFGFDGVPEAHLQLDHLQLALGVEAFYFRLGVLYLSLGFAGPQVADGL